MKKRNKNLRKYYSMKPANPQLYARAKRIINARYAKPSAYRSMAYIKEYKRLGGTFLPDHKPKTLRRWILEKWRDVNPRKTRKSYPVFRPTVRISKKTPLTVREISRAELLKQSRRKQRIKGAHNLRPFTRRNGGV